MLNALLLASVTTALILALRHELFAAVRSPTPGRSVVAISVAYLVGATIVCFRYGSDLALRIFLAYALHFAMFLVGYFGLSATLRLQMEPAPVRQMNFRHGWHTIFGKWAFLVAALGTTIFYVFYVGADRLLTALFRFVVSGEVDVSVLELRLSLASGEERWIAPGYLKQLRDILLPLGVLVVLFSMRRNSVWFILLALTLVPLTCVLIISTGERGPVLFFLLATVYSVMSATRHGIQSRRAAVVLLAIVVLMGVGAFAALTQSFASRYEGDMSVPLILADRVVTRGPEENLLSAPIWAAGAPFPGAGWLSELSTVLPGPQRTLSNLLHEHLGGGELGNSVLGAWLDVHYNFGWILGAAVSVLVGVAVALFTHLVNIARSISIASDICGLWISICMLFVLSPYGFLLYGPFVLSVCLFAMFTWHRSVAVLFDPRIGSAKLAQ